ncbi:MAG TPA: hypothetical protein VM689_20850 [Aliidongia sp.]|nr:hypothetical protein [Aliidongia sp.]
MLQRFDPSPDPSGLVAAEQIRDWQRRGVGPDDACRMLGVLHTRSWEVVFFHLIEAHRQALRRLEGRRRAA